MSQKYISTIKEWYKKIKPVYCPALDCDITFNAKGLYHLKYDGVGHRRSMSEYKHRLSLLPAAIELIKLAKGVDKENVRVNELNGQKIYYWSLAGIVNSSGLNLKVVLRREGNGNIIFYSVMLKRKTKKPH